MLRRTRLALTPALWSMATVAATPELELGATGDIVEISGGPGSTSTEGRCKAYTPAPITPAPWIETDMAVTDIDVIAEGESRSLPSRFRRKDNIAGAVL